MKTLREFLQQKGETQERESMINYPDDEYGVKLSNYKDTLAKLLWLISLLNDIYQVEEKDGEPFLVKKEEIKQDEIE